MAKPTEAARHYTIKGAKGNSRKLAKGARGAYNDELRVRRCIVCGNPNTETYPIHKQCHRKDY